MAMVPSLLCIPTYLTILRTLAAVTTHRHKSTRFRPSVCNFHRKYNTRAIASDSTSSVAAVTSTVSTQRYSEYGRLLPCPAESFQPRIEHLVVREEGTILDFITKALDLPPL
ncbi:hypothetical protein HanLR1_Chr00c0042g0698661 [Helianthus annuus]|nr:hypothetical protein HanLR1_Chr00c0042g0698661 [Helianthus annuus]